MELATTTLTIYRGTASNAYGDQTDVGEPHLTGIPAAAVESAKTVFDQATQRPSTIRTSMCVVPSWVDVIDTDTVKDERTGNFYMIEDITAQPTLGPPGDLILTLRWRSGVTVTSD